MKRILSLILCTAMITLTPGIVSADEAAENAVIEISPKAEEAQSLLKALSRGDTFKEISNQAVTRGEFVYAVIDLLGYPIGTGAQTCFVDVASGSKYADAVESALNLGLISSGYNFRPDDKITYNEAIKIAISVLGYSDIAKDNGGYPDGYLKIAADEKLLKNIEISDVMTEQNMAILLYNMLRSEVVEVEYTRPDTSGYSYSDKTLLYELYGICYTDGIITKSFVTSYDKEYSYTKGNSVVEVNGEEFYSELNIDEFFGMNCIVYYADDKGEKSIVSVYPVKNNEITIKLDEIDEFNGSKLEYSQEDSQRQKNIKVDENYLEVFNGKVTQADKAHLLDITGEARFVDNNEDNIYDIVFITHYDYVKVKNLDADDRIIEDTYSSKNNIVIDENKVIFSVADSNKNQLKLAYIKPGDILSVAKSPDGSIINIEILKTVISGTIESVNSDNEIIIDGTAYTVSEYADTNCDHRFRPGVTLSFYAGYNNEIAFVEFNALAYSYGYALSVFREEGAYSDYGIKLYTESGMFRTYMLAEKVKFDGENLKNAIAYDLLSEEFEPQLIRYKLDSDGMVNAVDTAIANDMSAITLEELEAEKNEDDKLIQNIYTETEFTFRSNGSFGTSFNASDAIIFIIPVKDGTLDTADVENREEFNVVDISSLRSGTKYSYFDVYDVDEYGCAKVMVGYSVERTSSPHSIYSGMSSGYSYGMVSKIGEGISEDGDIGSVFTIWTNGEFNEYFMDDTVTYLMAPGESIQRGDIVRFRLDGNEIKELILDFNADKLEGNREYDTRSAPINYGDTIISYQAGMLYNYNDKVCYYTGTVDAQTGEYDFTPANLINSLIKCNYICRYDDDMKTIMPIELNDLRSYRAYGEAADFVVIKQQNLNTQCVFVYGKGDE